jgi:hypothetical protein
MVFLTGGAVSPRVQRALETTGLQILEKPVSVSVLRAVVDRVLAQCAERVRP